MLRTLVLLLLAANLAFFAWTRGWFSPLADPPLSSEREPQRLSQQVRPESVRLLDDRSAVAARRAASAAASPRVEGAPGSGASAPASGAVSRTNGS